MPALFLQPAAALTAWEGDTATNRADVLLHALRQIGRSRKLLVLMVLLICWRLHGAPASPGGLRGRWERLRAGRECSCIVPGTANPGDQSAV